MVLCCGWTVATGALRVASVPVALVWFKSMRALLLYVYSYLAFDADIHVHRGQFRGPSKYHFDGNIPGLSLMVCPLKRE